MDSLTIILNEINIIIQRKNKHLENWLIIGAGEERDYKDWDNFFKDKRINWCGLNVTCSPNAKCCIQCDFDHDNLSKVIKPNTYDKILFDRGTIEWIQLTIPKLQILYDGLKEGGELYIPFVVFQLWDINLLNKPTDLQIESFKTTFKQFIKKKEATIISGNIPPQLPLSLKVHNEMSLSNEFRSTIENHNTRLLLDFMFNQPFIGKNKIGNHYEYYNSGKSYPQLLDERIPLITRYWKLIKLSNPS